MHAVTHCRQACARAGRIDSAMLEINDRPAGDELPTCMYYIKTIGPFNAQLFVEMRQVILLLISSFLLCNF